MNGWMVLIIPENGSNAWRPCSPVTCPTCSQSTFSLLGGDYTLVPMPVTLVHALMHSANLLRCLHSHPPKRIHLMFIVWFLMSMWWLLDPFWFAMTLSASVEKVILWTAGAHWVLKRWCFPSTAAAWSSRLNISPDRMRSVQGQY